MLRVENLEVLYSELQGELEASIILDLPFNDTWGRFWSLVTPTNEFETCGVIKGMEPGEYLFDFCEISHVICEASGVKLVNCENDPVLDDFGRWVSWTVTIATD